MIEYKIMSNAADIHAIPNHSSPLIVVNMRVMMSVTIDDTSADVYMIANK